MSGVDTGGILLASCRNGAAHPLGDQTDSAGEPVCGGASVRQRSGQRFLALDNRCAATAFVQVGANLSPGDTGSGVSPRSVPPWDSDSPCGREPLPGDRPGDRPWGDPPKGPPARWGAGIFRENKCCYYVTYVVEHEPVTAIDGSATACGPGRLGGRLKL
jgi:hypothetical protein